VDAQDVSNLVIHAREFPLTVRLAEKLQQLLTFTTTSALQAAQKGFTLIWPRASASPVSLPASHVTRAAVAFLATRLLLTRENYSLGTVVLVLAL